ncbi:PRA1-like protein [Vanrija pseudolonga]|uniref:PRA1 family protein n=1 Tax=Vanrija pseudolonga TaxID=143232 RepID=A0AAF0Y339_9TREE|nr:PRA1-like protein [Vanrija pseudolonga]
MDMVGYLNTAQEHVRSLKETRLGAFRPVGEFFDVTRISRPKDWSDYMKRASYNIRYFSANYVIIIALLAVYSLITNPVLLIALGFLIGGFFLISRFVPEPIEFNGKTITPQNLYTTLFVIGTLLAASLRSALIRVLPGLPLLYFSAPFSTFFWLVGSSGCIIGAHAGFLEPGVESEYAGLETV